MPKTIFQIDAKGMQTNCIAIGNGPEFCFIVGPGSFYLRSLITNSDIGELCTFITCDSHWVGYDDSNLLSLDDLLEFNYEIIKSIIKKFKLKKIGMLGFSAPACLAIEYIKKYPQDIAWLQLIGAALENLDPKFTFSNNVFMENASKEKIKKHESDQMIRFAIEQNDCNGNFYYFSENDYFLDSDKQRRLKPNSAWILETVSLYHKAFFRDSERYRQALISHWENNILGQYINPFFREHFFKNIFPTIKALDGLKDLANISFPIQVFAGKEDYIAPLSPKTKKELQLMHNVNLLEYEKCGHYVYIENNEQFYSDFYTYLQSCSIRC